MTLDELFNIWDTDPTKRHGIFAALEDTGVPLPWQEDPITFTPLALDRAYIDHSGEKTLRPLYQRFYDLAKNPTSALHPAAETLALKYAKKWKRLWKVMVSEYDPIQNYSMTEQEEAQTGRETSREGERNAHAANQTHTDTVNGVYGFNSVTGKPSDIAEGNANADSRQSDVEESREKENVENGRRLTRSGNIGVTTSQQMLQSEIELWKWNFFDAIFTDIDGVLSVGVYE